jgi:(p)ppGpp synthase/HD superfamily hydrolase
MNFTLQKNYQKAFLFAGEAHQNQIVTGTNANYLLHISNVTMEILIAYFNEPTFDVNFAIQVSILHDTLEDTSITYNDLKNNFGVNIADGVLALTKNSNLPNKSAKILDSLERIKKQPDEVYLVKIADRVTNLQKPPKNWNKDKVINYYNEAKIIEGYLFGKHNYLDNRLQFEINNYTVFF